MELTEKQQQILTIFRELYAETGKPVSPTAIGLKLGFPYASASSRISPTMRRLVLSRLAERNVRGQYTPIEQTDIQ